MYFNANLHRSLTKKFNIKKRISLGYRRAHKERKKSKSIPPFSEFIDPFDINPFTAVKTLEKIPFSRIPNTKRHQFWNIMCLDKILTHLMPPFSPKRCRDSSRNYWKCLWWKAPKVRENRMIQFYQSQNEITLELLSRSSPDYVYHSGAVLDIYAG